jgi:general secretion pathway protein G
MLNLAAAPRGCPRRESAHPVSTDILRPVTPVQKARFRSLAPGFTLLELMVVIAILGLLVFLVAPAVMRQFGNAKIKITRQAIAQFDQSLNLYKLDTGSFPTSEQGLQALLVKPSGVRDWSGPYIKGDKVNEDSWNHPYEYRSPSTRSGRDYDLCSMGPSGKPGGTGDDAPICN